MAIVKFVGGEEKDRTTVFTYNVEDKIEVASNVKISNVYLHIELAPVLYSIEYEGILNNAVLKDIEKELNTKLKSMPNDKIIVPEKDIVQEILNRVINSNGCYQNTYECVKILSELMNSDTVVQATNDFGILCKNWKK